ncbi:MAG: DUF4416 family protein [Chitinivibrionales bacterium]
MGMITKPPQAKLFLAILYNESAPVEEVLETCRQKFGREDYSLGPIPFDYSQYYVPEMGSPLQKQYMTFERPVDRDQLPSIKITTNELEQIYAISGKRIVNLDPGYITTDKLVLATTKDFYHRIYLGEGIYGEVTLHFRRGRFRHFSWTYPDYRDEKLLALLTRGRAQIAGESREE